MALVANGMVRLLTEKLTYAATLEWALFPDDTTIDNDTVLADLGTEAAWTGYTRITAGVYGAAFYDTPNNRASSIQQNPGSFLNNETFGVDFFVLALIDPADETLIWALNLTLQTIAPGSSFPIAPRISESN